MVRLTILPLSTSSFYLCFVFGFVLFLGAETLMRLLRPPYLMQEGGRTPQSAPLSSMSHFANPSYADVRNSDNAWHGITLHFSRPAYQGSQTGEGDKGDFHIGVGGYCQTDLQDPIVGPTGYWCAIAPPRGQCWDPATNKGRGCTW